VAGFGAKKVAALPDPHALTCGAVCDDEKQNKAPLSIGYNSPKWWVRFLGPANTGSLQRLGL